MSRSKIQNGLSWEFKGVSGKQRTAVDTITCDSERVFRPDLGVFPADEQVETNEVGNLRRRNVKQTF